MLVGLETFNYHIALNNGFMDLPGFIERIASLGVEGVQLNSGYLNSFLEADPTRTGQLRDMAADFGFFVEVDTKGTDPSYLTRMLQTCHALGADVLRTYVSCGGDLGQELSSCTGPSPGSAAGLPGSRRTHCPGKPRIRNFAGDTRSRGSGGERMGRDSRGYR